MGFWSNLFKGKKEEVLEINEVNTNSEEETTFENDRRFCDQKCELCQKVIEYERYKKMAGRYFHKKCYKTKLKEVKQKGLL